MYNCISVYSQAKGDPLERSLVFRGVQMCNSSGYEAGTGIGALRCNKNEDYLRGVFNKR